MVKKIVNANEICWYLFSYMSRISLLLWGGFCALSLTFIANCTPNANQFCKGEIYGYTNTFCNFSALDKASGRRSIAENCREKET